MQDLLLQNLTRRKVTMFTLGAKRMLPFIIVSTILFYYRVKKKLKPTG